MAVELTSEFEGVCYGDTPVQQMGANIKQELEHVNAPTPIQAKATIQCERSFDDKIESAHETLQAPSGGSWLSDAVGMACAKLSQTSKEVAPVLEDNKPPVQDTARAVELAVAHEAENNHHTKVAEQNFAMKPSWASA